MQLTPLLCALQLLPLILQPPYHLEEKKLDQAHFVVLGGVFCCWLWRYRSVGRKRSRCGSIRCESFYLGWRVENGARVARGVVCQFGHPCLGLSKL